MKIRDLYKLIGIAKILDNLWENSYYSMGEKAVERLEKELIYYFGENWSTEIATFLKDKKQIPSFKDRFNKEKINDVKITISQGGKIIDEYYEKKMKRKKYEDFRDRVFNEFN